MRYFIITLMVMFLGCQVSCQEEVNPNSSLAETTKADGRLLGIAITEPANKDFDAAFRIARSAGMQVVSLSLAWDDVEKAPGKFESPLPKVANAFYGASKVRVSLRLATFDTNNNRYPADLRDRPLDDPGVIARFNAFAEWVIGQLPDVELADVSIGNEVDASLGTDSKKWAQYTTFFIAARKHILDKRSGVRIGSNLTFGAFAGATEKFVAKLNRVTDVVMVSYYPLTREYKVRPPTEVCNDFASMCHAFPGKTIHITEAGYPSGADCGSSPELQKEFIEQVFAAWDAHAKQVRMVMFVWLHDLPMKDVEHDAKYYGISDRAFIGYLGTLGLRTHDQGGTDKPAFKALRVQAKARGW